MGSLGAILSGMVLTDVGLMIRRAKRNSVFLAFAGILFITAYVFFLVAGAIALSAAYGPLAATLILGGVSLGLGIILLIVMAGISAREKRLAVERRRQSQMQTNIAIATALTLFKKKPLLAAGLAVGIGALLGVTRGSGKDA